MRDIPVVLDGYKLTVVEPPAPKTREDGTVVTTREGVTQFVVSLFAKVRVQPGQRAPKGEEIKVTLETDPGEGFGEDTRVALVSPRVTPYEFKNDRGELVAGISFNAMGLTPVGSPAPRGEK